MWPARGEALSRTIEAEAAIADLYAEALRRWAPTAQAAVLPSLTAATELPPDPDAVAETQTAWDQYAEATILAGLVMLWATSYVEAAVALGIVLPPLPDLPDTPAVTDLSRYAGADGEVLAIVARAADTTAADLLDDFTRVDTNAAARAAVVEFVDAQRPTIAATPAVVQAKVEAAIAEPKISVNVIPEDRAEVLQAEARKALDPASQQMRDIARNQGYQAAGVMNAAILAAAVESEKDIGEELQKTWICTIDGKTRPTHWAADGQRVPLAGAFTIGQEQLRYPGDPTATAAERKNCRCRMGILAPDEELPDEVDRHTERLDGRDSVAINRHGRTQAEEIERREQAGNVRARDDEDGIGRVASGGWTAPSEQEHDMSKGAALVAGTEQDTDVETFLTWSGYIGKLGVATSDRRILAADIDLTMREFPHPMAWCKQSSGGHYDSFTVGVVETAEIDGDRVFATGYFLNSPEAVEVADQVHHKVSAPSLDLAAAEYIFTDEDGNEIEGDLFDWWEENGEPFTYFTKAEVTGFTLVQTPAFDGIDITLGERETRDLAVVASVVASVDGPRVKTYDAALFADPKLTRPTAPTMDNKTGRIYGHLAEWGHAIRGGNGDLTPRNRNGYANFHTSQVQLDNGKQLSVGRLTVQGGHASTSAGVTIATARAHYDNVACAFGLVRVGEDRFGIWFSGVPAPGVDPETFQAGMCAPLSGDWRDCGAGLDMIAAHAVNSPGFPIYSAVTGPDGRDVALVASLGPSRKSKKSGGGFTLDRESLKTLLTEVVETVDRRRADAALAQQTAPAPASTAQADAAEAPTPNQRVEQLLAEV